MTRSRMTRCVALIGALLMASPALVHADDDAELYARVIVTATAVTSGPGPSYRRVYVAHRGEVFPIRARATSGYWFRIELPDATSGWIRGDAVYNHEVSDDEASGGRFLPGLFAPPPLMDANGEVAIQFGVLGSGGMMAVRPALLLDPTFGLELNFQASVARGGQLTIGGASGIVNVFPRSPIVPFVVVGGGVAISDPNADTFLLRSGTTGVFSAGGGFRIGLKYRLTLRLEARAFGFHQPDRYVSQEEFSAGLTVFF